MQGLEGIHASFRQLIDLCFKLERSLLAFEKILDREHDAVRQSDIRLLEAICQEKTFFAEDIEDRIKKLQDLQKKVSILILGAEVESSQSKFKFTEHLEALQKKSKALGPETEMLFENLEQAVEKLIKRRIEIFPKIEANNYLVKRLVQFHRETYAFWQTVAAEAESTYGSSGKTKSPMQRSILSVRT